MNRRTPKNLASERRVKQVERMLSACVETVAALEDQVKSDRQKINRAFKELGERVSRLQREIRQLSLRDEDEDRPRSRRRYAEDI
jgi:hypothetical protein